MSKTLNGRVLALLALVSCGFGLPACLPALTPKPEPSPVVFHISLAPSLNTLRPLLNSCTQEQPNLGLVVTESPAPDLEQTGLALQWGANNLPGGFAAVLGEETLVFIVHPQNPIDHISRADFQAIYSGTRRDWPDGGPQGEIQPLAYPSSTDIQLTFAALADEPPFPANVTSLVPDPAAMIEAVAGSPAAIGFIPRRWVDERVKIVQIEGIREDRLRQPILSLSKSEPEGPIKSWLLCLQAGLAE